VPTYNQQTPMRKATSDIRQDIAKSKLLFLGYLHMSKESYVVFRR
jgi:hypothetical protein